MTLDRQQAFSGTKEAAPGLRLDAARLASYLEQHVKGFAGPLTISQFKGGQSNPTYLLATPARRYVLRRKPPGKLLPSAHAVDREYRVIGALHRQDFPVAEPLCFCADESVTGTAFYVMEFADGRVSLVAVRAFDDNGQASNYGIMRSIAYALGKGARVINTSIDLGLHGRDAAPRPPVEAWLRVIETDEEEGRRWLVEGQELLAGLGL